MMQRFSGNKVNNKMITSKTANFDAKMLNLVIFFRFSGFFIESSYFCREARGNTVKKDSRVNCDGRHIAPQAANYDSIQNLTWYFEVTAR